MLLHILANVRCFLPGITLNVLLDESSLIIASRSFVRSGDECLCELVEILVTLSKLLTTANVLPIALAACWIAFSLLFAPILLIEFLHSRFMCSIIMQVTLNVFPNLTMCVDKAAPL